MKIFATGIYGFIGSNLANRIGLVTDFFGCDNAKFGFSKNLFPDVEYSFVLKSGTQRSFMEADLRSYSEEDVLVHMATSNLIFAQQNCLETFHNNAYETIKLFDRFKGKIIYTSTASVYNHADIFPTPEDANIHVVNAYDTSKYIAEMYLKQRGNYTTLRLSNVYGTNQRAENPYCGVLGKFIQSALDDKSMTIIGEGSQTRDYTYIDDVVNAIIKSIELPAQNTEINIATGVETSVKELAQLVWKVVNKPQRYTRTEPRSIDGITRRCLDISKAERLLGWTPTTLLESGVIKTVEWQKKELHLQKT